MDQFNPFLLGQFGRVFHYYITLKHEPVLAFAGIYDVWHNGVTNEDVYTYSIITTRANKLMSEIHNTNFRMPVILHRELEEQWLDPNLGEKEIADLLRCYSSRGMEAIEIRNDFLRKQANDPSILAPAAHTEHV